MKKITAIILTALIFVISVMPLTAFAWGEPQLMLAASYNADKKTITVQYRVLEFTGTESADFRLRYNPDVVEMADYETAEMSNVLMEVVDLAGTDDTIAIQFVDMYYAEEEDCEEDGSATIVTFTFNVISDTATDAVFIATADSYNMDPNSVEKHPERATLKISLADGNTGVATIDNYDISAEPETGSEISKVIIAAVVTAVVFVAGLVAIVIKYRKK